MPSGKVDVAECCVTWTVMVGTDVRTRPRHYLKSPRFLLPGGGGNGADVWINIDSGEYVSLGWGLIDCEDIDTLCKVSLFKHGQLSHTQAMHIIDCYEETRVTCSTFIRRSELTSKTGLLDGNRLLIHMKFWYDYDEPVCLHETQTATTSCLDDISLHDNSQFATNDLFSPVFNKWHQETDLADMTVEVGNEHFKMHKFVFASRSQVFFRMFTQDMSESNTSSMQITDMTPGHFRQLAEYMYTGRVTDVKESASYLLNAAEKYELEGLKGLCEEALISTISENSALDVLVLADLYRAQKLKRKALDYAKQHAHAVTSSEGWMTFMTGNPQLATEFVRHLLPTKANPPK